MWYNSRYPGSLLSSIAGFKSELKGLIKETQKGTGNQFPANLMIPFPCGNTGAGMMSFPNFAGLMKNLHRPNLVQLARLCEEEGIDLRIIVLTREPGSIVASTIDHRHFNGNKPKGTEIKVLTSAASALNGQLQALDPGYVSFCAPMEDKTMTFMSHAAELFQLPQKSLLKAAEQSLVKPHTYTRQELAARQERREFVKSMNSLVYRINDRCPNI
jgi:hypothetical protein